MLYLHVGIRVNQPSYTWNAFSATKRIMQCAAPIFWEIPLTDVWCQQVLGGCGVRCEKYMNSVPMSKRKPTSSQHGIDRYFCKSRRTESPVEEGEKTANDGDQQTLVIPTTSNSTARVDEGKKTAETWSYKSPEQN